MLSQVADGKTEVLILKARINMNLNCQTREHLETQRHDVVMNLLRNTLLEVERDLVAEVNKIEASSLNKYDKGRENGRRIRELIVEEVANVVEHYSNSMASKFNDDYAYQLALQDAKDLRRVAMGKFKYWRKTPGVFHSNFNSMSMWKVDSMKLGHMWARYKREKQRAAPAQHGLSLSGLTWLKIKNAPSARPQGVELTNPALTIALASKTDFTEEEWAEIGVGEAQEGCFVLVGDVCYIPADLRALAMRVVQMEALVGMSNDDEMLFDDCAGVEGNTALIRASANGDSERVELLLDAGCDIHVAENTAQHFTALHAAAANGHVAVVRILISRGANLEARNKRAETPLITACRSGNAACVAALVEANADVMASMPSNGASGLCIAAQNGHKNVVELMCAAGGEDLLLQTDNENVSALVSAVRHKHTHIVSHMVTLSSKQLLIQDRHDDSSCLHWAVREGNAAIENLLRTSGGPELCALLNRKGQSADDIKASRQT